MSLPKSLLPLPSRPRQGRPCLRPCSSSSPLVLTSVCFSVILLNSHRYIRAFVYLFFIVFACCSICLSPTFHLIPAPLCLCFDYLSFYPLLNDYLEKIEISFEFCSANRRRNSFKALLTLGLSTSNTWRKTKVENWTKRKEENKQEKTKKKKTKK